MTVPRLSDRVAIVTGGGRGLGRAYCDFLASHGASVVLTDIDKDAVAQAIDEITAAGGAAAGAVCDAAEWSSASDVVALASAKYGRLDVVVNNAGNARPRLLHELTEDDWDAIVGVHLKGAGALAVAAMRYWRERRARGEYNDASVINITSVAGLTGVPGTAPYSAAKAGVVGLSKAMAAEGAAIGVRSNVVSPVAHTPMTRMTHDVPPADPSGYEAGDPSNVAPLVGWLAAAGCPANDQIFHVVGTQIVVLRVPTVHAVAGHRRQRWTLDELDHTLPSILVDPLRRETMLTELTNMERS